MALVRRCGVEQRPGAHPRARDDGADLRHLGWSSTSSAPHLKTATDVLRALFVVARRRGRPGQAAEAAAEHPAPDPPLRPADARVLPGRTSSPRTSAATRGTGSASARSCTRTSSRPATRTRRWRSPRSAAPAWTRTSRPARPPRSRASACALRTFAHPARGGAAGAGPRARAGARAAPRPGELVRRLDHLLRASARRWSPRPRREHASRRSSPRPVLLHARIGVDPRRAPARSPKRVFFPRGEVTTRSPPTTRARRSRSRTSTPSSTPSSASCSPARARAGAARHRRCSTSSSQDLTVPFRERHAARAAAHASRAAAASRSRTRTRCACSCTGRAGGAARGPRPQRRALRRGLAHARPVRLHRAAASRTAPPHSGDLTSAPAPLGASEFVDLDLPSCARPASATSSRSSSPTTTSRSTR